MAASQPDYRELARRTPRAAFVQAHPWFFIVGLEPMVKPRGRISTSVFEVLEGPTGSQQRGATFQDEVTPVVPIHEPAPGDPELLVLAVRKVITPDPSRITVGRSSNNDLVIPDADVSRTHAFFRLSSDHVALGDAGSVNGTMINGKLLDPGGATQLVIPGDTLRFAFLDFEFLDAGPTWDRIHALTA
jgi:hypothetical protein